MPVTYMVERWSQWEFLYYAIPMGLFTLLCNGAPLHLSCQLALALALALPPPPPPSPPPLPLP